MTRLKPITAAGIAAALHKAERYRLLNDSAAAESICLDILAIEPANQRALVMLLLAITDQFGDELGERARQAHALVPKLDDEYGRAYYAGIIHERRAKAQLHRANPGAVDIAVDYLHQAMQCYARAEAMRPAGDDDSILRWNSCARMLVAHDRADQASQVYEPALDD